MFCFREMINKLFRPLHQLVSPSLLTFRQCHLPSVRSHALTPLSDLPRPVTVQGWVKSFRRQKQNTFLDISDGTSSHHVQVIAATELVPHQISFHSCVEVTGSLVKSHHPGQAVELQAQQLSLVGECHAGYPFQPRRFVKPEFVRSQPGCKAKTNSVASLMRIRNAASQAVHRYFQSREFLQIHTPVLTSNDCEGGGEVFSVAPSSPAEDGPYWDSPVHLTVSGQLHLEALCNGISRVYTFNPAFRAERGRTRRHLAEFWMIEAEIAFVDDIETIIKSMESLLKFTASEVLDSCAGDIDLYAKATKGVSNVENIAKFVDSEVVTMTYTEAVRLLSSQASLGPLQGGDLGREHEQWLCHHVGSPVAVINWPGSIKPFYMRQVPGQPDLVSGVDLLLSGVGELCGGSLREACPRVLQQRLGSGEHGLDWYLQLRRQGAANTGGFGLGFERMIQFLAGVENIRDTIPFHRAPHSCRL